MTTRIETENSTYEIDWDGKRVRRVTGVNEPTTNFGADNVWRELTDVQAYYGRVMFVFPDGKATITSEIRSSEEIA